MPRTTPPPKRALEAADRVLRDLANRMTGMDDEDAVKLTAREIRAMLFKFYGIEGEARKAQRFAASRI